MRESKQMNKRKIRSREDLAVDIVVWFCLIIVLLIRPQGFVSKKGVRV